MSTIAPSNALDHTLLQIQNCGHRIDRVTWKNRLVARLQGGEDLCDYLVRSASFAQALDLKCPDCDAPIDRFFHPAKDTVDQISMAVPELSKERAFLEAQDLILNKNCLGLSQEDLEYCREMADRLPKGEDPRTQRDNFELWWEVIPRGSVIPGEFKTSLEQLKQRLRNLEEDESEPGECAIEFSLDLLEECIAKTVQNWSNPALPYCIALYRLGGMQDRENEIWAALKELKEICRPHPLVDKLFEKLRASVTGFSRCSLSSPAEIGELLKNYPNLQYLEPRFTTKEAFDAFLDILRTSASPLTAIEFDACEYAKNREEMAAILDALRDNKSIRKVSFSGFNSGDCELPISDLIRSNDTLQELYLWACNFTDQELLKMAEALNDNTSLHTLDLGNCRFAASLDIWSRFFELLGSTRPFKLLSLAHGWPEVERFFNIDLKRGDRVADLDGFRTYLMSNPPIQELDLRGLQMKQPDAEKLVEALAMADQIQDLYLRADVLPASSSKDPLIMFAREKGILKLDPSSYGFPEASHRSAHIPLPERHVDYEKDRMDCLTFLYMLGGPDDRYELMGMEGCAKAYLAEGIGIRDGINYRKHVCGAVIDAEAEIVEGGHKQVDEELLNIVRKFLRKHEVPEAVLLEMLENAYGPAVWSTWEKITKLLKESVAS